MDKENDTLQETSEIEKKEEANWIEVTVNLFKKILGYNFFVYGGKKDF